MNITTKTWNELNTGEIITLYAAIHNKMSDDKIENAKILQLFIVKLLYDFDIELVDESIRPQICEMLCADLIDVDQEGSISIKLELTKNPYPEIEQYKCKFEDEIENATISEVAIIFTHLNSIFASKKPSALKLLAYAYEMPLQDASKIPIIIQQILLFHFACCRNKVVTDYPEIFSSDSKEEGWGFAGMIMDLAGSITALSDVENKNFHDVLLYLKYQDFKRKKAELKNALS